MIMKWISLSDTYVLHKNNREKSGGDLSDK